MQTRFNKSSSVSNVQDGGKQAQVELLTKLKKLRIKFPDYKFTDKFENELQTISYRVSEFSDFNAFIQGAHDETKENMDLSEGVKFDIIEITKEVVKIILQPKPDYEV